MYTDNTFLNVVSPFSKPMRQADKSMNCDHCEDCQLAEGKECTRATHDEDRVQCCTEDGMFKEHMSGCTRSGQAGWCAQDVCQVHDCVHSWASLDRTCDDAHTAR
jgi:hypothetical protein